MYLCRLFLFIYFCILRHYDLFSGEVNERIECNKDGAQLTVLCVLLCQLAAEVLLYYSFTLTGISSPREISH